MRSILKVVVYKEDQGRLLQQCSCNTPACVCRARLESYSQGIQYEE